MKYALGVLAVVIIAFIAIFAVANKGGNNNGGKAKQDTSVARLSNLQGTDYSVSMTIEGKVVGEDTRRAIRITVNQNERTVSVLNGYSEQVERTETFANTDVAFNTFTSALDHDGFLRKQLSLFSDHRGVCAQGNVYRYAYTGEDGHEHELWSTSCNQKDGPFAGNGSNIRKLFQAQITDYNKFVQGVRL